MAESQTTTERKRQLWSDRIESWKQSGLSQRAYCEQHQLALGTFSNWRSHLKKQVAGDQTGKPQFLPVTLQQSRHATLVLKINNRHSIEISSDFDPDLLSKVVQAVQQVA